MYQLFIILSLFMSLKNFLIEACTGAVSERLAINSSFSKMSVIILSNVSFSFLKNDI